jgi:hypothetical protein
MRRHIQIEKVDVPEGKKGDWTVEKFTTSHFSFGYALQGRPVPKGETFTRLMRGDTLVMSDTPAEQRDHYEFFYQAKGNVLIAGLGLGMILDAVAKKPEVKHITVVELSKDLIDLVGPTYTERYGKKVLFIDADFMTIEPPKGMRYDAVWVDIWDTIDADNLPAMAKLQRRWRRFSDWVGFWARREALRQRREERERQEFRDVFRSRSLENAFDQLSKGDIKI